MSWILKDALVLNTSHHQVLRVVSSKEEPTASLDTIRDAFQAVAQDLPSENEHESLFTSIISGHNTYVEESTEYLRRLGLFANDEQAIFINGNLYLITDDQVRAHFWEMIFQNNVLMTLHSHGLNI